MNAKPQIPLQPLTVLNTEENKVPSSQNSSSKRAVSSIKSEEGSKARKLETVPVFVPIVVDKQAEEEAEKKRKLIAEILHH